MATMLATELADAGAAAEVDAVAGAAAVDAGAAAVEAGAAAADAAAAELSADVAADDPALPVLLHADNENTSAVATAAASTVRVYFILMSPRTAVGNCKNTFAFNCGRARNTSTACAILRPAV
ncbi:MAG TPA: hypothetical protein VF292_11805 [Rhodanobacteraceae bacterium]